jgi:transposase
MGSSLRSLDSPKRRGQMLDVSRFGNIYFYGGVVDFRKSIDGLSALVQETLSKNPFDPNLFIFVSRDKRKVKILYWDFTGFVLFYKRLERDKFPMARGREAKTIELSREQFDWLLSGIDWWKIKRHNPVSLEKVG